MGLADSSAKRQRIADDPRNTKWATDTNRPGYKMLLNMGWSPSHATTLTPDGPKIAKRLISMPIAKEDTLGLGASPTASSIFSKFGSKGLSFVTASKDGSAEVARDRHNKTEGGLFANLLERLNAANAVKLTDAATSTTTQASIRISDSNVENSATITATTVQTAPRNAARAKYRKAKLAARASATDLVGILGIDPVNTSDSITESSTSTRPTSPIEPTNADTITKSNEPSNLSNTVTNPIEHADSGTRLKTKKRRKDISTTDASEEAVMERSSTRRRTGESAHDSETELARKARKQAKKVRREERDKPNS